MVMEKQPSQFSQMVENHEIRSIVQQVVAGEEIALNEAQILAINEWMDTVADGHVSDRKRWVEQLDFLLLCAISAKLFITSCVKVEFEHVFSAKTYF